jgi:ferredoxin-NADP reductase
MYKYVVDNVTNITVSTLLVSLKQQEGERLLSFQPGQYAAISAYRGIRPTPARCFSIVNSPTQQGQLQFSMRVKGSFTRAIAGLKAGDMVDVRGPFGGFVLDLATEEKMVFMAGGIGITPFMSMASYANDVKSPKSITLFYSCQSQDDIPFFDDLKRLQQENHNFKVVYVIGTGAVDKLGGQTVSLGRITPELLSTVLSNTFIGTTFFICGPPPFMNGMMKTLKSKGVLRSRMITEAFAQGPHRQTGKMRSWPNNIYVLSAVGVVLGSLVVMVSDLLKTLPLSSLASNSVVVKSQLTNSRQQDLDQLVNNLPTEANSAPESDGARSAQQAAAAAAAAVASGATASLPKATIATPRTSVTPVTPTSPVVTTPTPTPAPAPKPKTCTTTQSGVTTCV